MPERVAEAPWLFWLLEALHGAQTGLLGLLHALGLVDAVDGQPAWPWAQRLAGENLLIDLGQARQLAGSLALTAAALGLLLLALWWRRGRPWLLALAVLAVVLAPWPARQVLLAPATPTSFHVNPLPFADTAIAAGAAQYQRLCLQCHGAAGNGQGPEAARQAVWPPSFVGPLLWRRADGELLWAIRHGLHAADGRATMPAFAEALDVEQTWAVLHYLRALGAGQLLQAAGNWAQPVHLPDMRLRCHAAHRQTLHDWQGQRLLLATTAHVQTLMPDPRLVTVWLPPADTPAAIPDNVDCLVADPVPARQALALVNGYSQMGEETDMQLLTDRAGWLRARNARGAVAWADEDLLCRTADGTAQPAGLPEDGLSRIIRTMDAEPVRLVKGGRVH